MNGLDGSHQDKRSSFFLGPDEGAVYCSAQEVYREVDDATCSIQIDFCGFEEVEQKEKRWKTGQSAKNIDMNSS